jgi:hypothetical protein
MKEFLPWIVYLGAGIVLFVIGLIAAKREWKRKTPTSYSVSRPSENLHAGAELHAGEYRR